MSGSRREIMFETDQKNINKILKNTDQEVLLKKLTAIFSIIRGLSYRDLLKTLLLNPNLDPAEDHPKRDGWSSAPTIENFYSLHKLLQESAELIATLSPNRIIGGEEESSIVVEYLKQIPFESSAKFDISAKLNILSQLSRNEKGEQKNFAVLEGAFSTIKKQKGNESPKQYERKVKKHTIQRSTDVSLFIGQQKKLAFVLCFVDYIKTLLIRTSLTESEEKTRNSFLSKLNAFSSLLLNLVSLKKMLKQTDIDTLGREFNLLLQYCKTEEFLNRYSFLSVVIENLENVISSLPGYTTFAAGVAKEIENLNENFESGKEALEIKEENITKELITATEKEKEEKLKPILQENSRLESEWNLGYLAQFKDIKENSELPLSVSTGLAQLEKRVKKMEDEQTKFRNILNILDDNLNYGMNMLAEKIISLPLGSYKQKALIETLGFVPTPVLPKKFEFLLNEDFYTTVKKGFVNKDSGFLAGLKLNSPSGQIKLEDIIPKQYRYLLNKKEREDFRFTQQICREIRNYFDPSKETEEERKKKKTLTYIPNNMSSILEDVRHLNESKYAHTQESMENNLEKLRAQLSSLTEKTLDTVKTWEKEKNFLQRFSTWAMDTLKNTFGFGRNVSSKSTVLKITSTFHSLFQTTEQKVRKMNPPFQPFYKVLQLIKQINLNANELAPKDTSEKTIDKQQFKKIEILLSEVAHNYKGSEMNTNNVLSELIASSEVINRNEFLEILDGLMSQKNRTPKERELLNLIKGKINDLVEQDKDQMPQFD